MDQSQASRYRQDESDAVYPGRLRSMSDAPISDHGMSGSIKRWCVDCIESDCPKADRVIDNKPEPKQTYKWPVMKPCGVLIDT